MFLDITSIENIPNDILGYDLICLIYKSSQRIYEQLGSGHAESTYQKALLYELSLYNISIDKIIESMYIYMESKNFFLPIEKANTLEIDTVRQGKDYCVYRVTKTNTDLKIWERINI